MGDRGRGNLGIPCFSIPTGVHTSFLICCGFDGYGGDSSFKKILQILSGTRNSLPTLSVY